MRKIYENYKGDSFTEVGAKRLKRKIESYWSARGREVTVDLVRSGFVPQMRSARTDIRSDMKNGIPQQGLGAAP